jgi:carboxylate-amine ligase
VLAISSLVSAAADRVRRESLSVLPREDLRVFKVAGGALSVPGFGYLNGELFRAAMTVGTESPAVNSYLHSVLRFSGAELGFEALRTGGSYRTTEAGLLYDFASPISWIPVERGLELVHGACDELEKQVASLRREAAEAAKAGASGD